MNNLKIGIVEDDLIIVQSIREMLVASGYLVGAVARRYSEAIAMLEDDAPDLLLLDVCIPGKPDGIDVAHTLVTPYFCKSCGKEYQLIEKAH